MCSPVGKGGRIVGAGIIEYLLLTMDAPQTEACTPNIPTEILSSPLCGHCCHEFVGTRVFGCEGSGTCDKRCINFLSREGNESNGMRKGPTAALMNAPLNARALSQKVSRMRFRQLLCQLPYDSSQHSLRVNRGRRAVVR